MKNITNSDEIPMGLGMALAENLKAMERFSQMSEKEQQAIIEGTHQIHSKKEMQAYVNRLISQ